MKTVLTAESGLVERALADAQPLAELLEAAGDVNFVEVRALQLRLLAERGAHEQAPPIDTLVANRP